MAINPALLSNLSVGAFNAPSPALPTPASSLYGPKSVPPVDAIQYSLKKTASVTGLQYPNELPKYYMRIGISEYSRIGGNGGNMMAVARLNPISTIYLPLPGRNLVDQSQVVYDQAQLSAPVGNAFNAYAGGANAVKGNEGQMINNSQAIAGGLAGTAASLGLTAVQSIISNRIGTNVPVADLASTVARVAGYTPNQFITILLKGPAYKRHEFTWTVSAHNQSESDNLQTIFNTINNAKAPGIMFGGAIFTFPKVFTVAWMPNSKYMYKFKPAVVESFDVDYGGAGMPSFFRSGAPSIIQFRLRLLELEYWLAGNYSGSNDPTDVQRLESFGPTINHDEVPILQ